MSLTQKVIDANIEVHSRLASQYEGSEPHFRAENVAKVDARIRELVHATGATDLLDLGCGTGFIIDIAKPYVRRIVGVDVTPAMLERVKLGGAAHIELVTCDTGAYAPTVGAFQLVTAYSFLHHLADVRPTLETAWRALGAGGVFYADLEPNFYFWDSIRSISASETLHPLVRREVDAVLLRGDDVESRFGVASDTFNQAEFGKNIAGGFREESLRELLHDVGFREVAFRYEWFLGEGFLINSGTAPRPELIARAAVVNEALQQALPVSRGLFKYIGFAATK